MASQTAETSLREIVFDRLPEAGPSLEVLLLDNVTFHADDECGPTRPHRHDYHELIWMREGAAEHLIDREVSGGVVGAAPLVARRSTRFCRRAP